MAAASSSGAWDAPPSAGAAEPGAGGVTRVLDDEKILRVAFYNVGLQQSALNIKNRTTAEQRCEMLADDIAEGFRKHRLDLLCLCELGEHEIGLQGRKNLGSASRRRHCSSSSYAWPIKNSPAVL